ncbi:MAG: XTP/dITP diphosphatase [Negativicutes bacterium]|jgi:XTP/dITP diphosphohydrolase
MNISELVVATKNRGKVREIEAALGTTGIRIISLDECGAIPEPVEDGATFLDNALLKARYYMHATGKPCLADDSGLEVDVLNGAPGVLSARYAGENATTAERNAKLLKELAGVPDIERTARFCCAMVVMSVNEQYIESIGTCEGLIMAEPRGNGGFGYDPLFFSLDANQGMAELDMQAKNTISHRGKALRQIVEKLAG